MKILTLNAHSHAIDFPQEIFHKNLDVLAEYIVREQVDVAALQEVCQTKENAAAEGGALDGYVPLSPDTVIREDNYVFQLIRRLRQKGSCYYWTWCGIKIGYGRFDEGLAIISRLPIEQAESYDLTDVQDYGNWKTRKAIGVKAAGTWFISTHMGWWEDADEPFSRQMDRLQEKLEAKKEAVFLMGDFNSPSDRKGAGYDYVRGCGWLDTCRLSGKEQNDITVPGKIDGWGEDAKEGLCIDYIWADRPVEVISSRAVFSGETEPVISDHFGVAAEVAY